MTQPEQRKPQGWGEPWEVDDGDSAQWGLFAEDGSEIAYAVDPSLMEDREAHESYAESERKLRRAKACVNALAGIANPDKLGELLAACRELDSWNHWDAPEELVARWKATLAAIGALPAGGEKS